MLNDNVFITVISIAIITIALAIIASNISYEENIDCKPGVKIMCQILGE